jgi:hypothetical protein
MKKIVLIAIFMIHGVLRAQITYNNFPDTVVKLLTKKINVQSYGKIKIEEDVVLLDISPINQNNTL